MTQPKRGLGRGLDALFGGAATAPPSETEHPAEPASTPPEPREERRPEPPPSPVATTLPQAPAIRRGGPDQLDLDLIAPNPEQPRTNFEPEKLRELSDSIREHGIIQPLVVSRDEDGGYRLIAGERRLQRSEER